MSAVAAFWPQVGAALGELATDATQFFHNALAFDHTSFPVDPTLFYAFVGAAILIEITPGPNMGYLVTLTITRGRAAGFATVVGVTLGLAVYMVAAAFGITEIFLRYPTLYQALRVAGVLFMLWLAFDAWRDAEGAEDGEKDERSYVALALRGFLANVLNPKSAVFYIALLPSFIQTEHAGPQIQALLLGATHIAISIAAHLSLVLLAGKLGAALTTKAGERRLVVIKRVLAVLLALVALWLAYETRAKAG